MIEQDNTATSAEQQVWSGTPSQWQNLWAWVSCILVVTIPWALWRALVTKNTRYVLTDQRLKTTVGVFNRITDDLELYRVKDTHFQQTFWQRRHRAQHLGHDDADGGDRRHPRRRGRARTHPRPGRTQA